MSFEIKIISLLSDTKKREEISNNLCKLDLDFRIVDAVDGKNLSAIDYFINAKNSNFWFNRKQFLSPSEYGCFSSHRKAIEEFVTNSKSDWLLVLEDDVMFDDRLSDLLSNHVDGLPTNNIYVLGGQDGLSSINRVLFGGSFGGKYKFKKSIMKTHRWIYRTCCYLIHKNHANELLSLMKKETYVADNWGFVIKNTNLESVCYHNMVSHPFDLTGSHIEQERLLLRNKC